MVFVFYEQTTPILNEVISTAYPSIWMGGFFGIVHLITKPFWVEQVMDVEYYMETLDSRSLYQLRG